MPKPRFKLAYITYLLVIAVVSLYYYINHQSNLNASEIHPAITAYFICKGFLIFGNLTLPFKQFHYNKIIYHVLQNLGIGIIMAFLYLRLYDDQFLILLDCGLCLITLFSLMKMHQNKNARSNYL